MSELVYNGNNQIKIDEIEIQIDDYFDDTLFLRSKEISDDIRKYDLTYLNTYFKKYIHDKLLPIENLILSNNVNRIVIKNIDAIALAVIEIAYRNDIDSYFNRTKATFFYIENIFKGCCKFIAGLFIVYLNIIKSIFTDSKIDITKKEHICIIHSGTSYKVLDNYFKARNADKVFYYFDPIVVKKKNDKSFVSFYDFLTAKNIFQVIYLHLKSSFSDLKTTFKFFKKINSSHFFSIPFVYFSFRIPHYQINRILIDLIFEKNNFSRFYSGEKESRWGYLLNSISEKYNSTGISIPHGLHYGLKYPHTIFGDVMICNNLMEMEVLSKLYPQKTFKNNYLIERSNSTESFYSKIVYFTEGRDHKKDEHIINYLVKYFDLHVKLHPNDKMGNYNFNRNIQLINNFEEAICNSISIARNSTILLQATKNNSLPISVLLNSKDIYFSKHLYIALSDSQIIKIFVLENLVTTINKYATNHPRP